LRNSPAASANSAQGRAAQPAVPTAGAGAPPLNGLALARPMREDGTSQGEWKPWHLRKGYWTRFLFGFALAFVLCFLNFRTDTLPLHVAKALVASLGAGYLLARFGDIVVRPLLRLLFWLHRWS